MRWLKLQIHKCWDIIIYKCYLEEVFLDLLCLQPFYYVLYDFFRFYSLPPGGPRGASIFTLFLIIPIFVVKLFKRGGANKFITLWLIREIKRYPLFFFLGIYNILAFIILFSNIYVDGIILWLMAIFLRLCILTEKLALQNRVLKDAIEDTSNLGHPSIKTPLADEQTIEAIQALTGIRDNYVEAMNEKMKSEKMKTELITNISHDLKTPLTSIINYADILNKKEKMDDEAKNYIQILGRNSDRLKSLIIDLIDASKTGTGNVHIERGFIEFNELVSQIYGDFDTVYKDKNLEFIYEPTEESIVLYSDGNLLSRIIQNLISNAWKYSLANTRVYAKSDENMGILYFSIKNISERKLNMSADELMEQFIRGERSRNTEGSGLGLYIARNLVELLGGECRIVIDGDFFQVFLEIPKDVEE